MKYLLKQTILPIVYLVFMSIIAFGILCVGNNLTWLKITLSILNLALYGYIVGAVAKKEGEDALKVRIANDAERLQIIRTGEDRPLKLKEEYKTWKGFVVGLLACVPLIILLMLHVILTAINPDLVGAGAIANLIYLPFGAFIRIDSSISVVDWHYYFNLIAVLILPLITGIPYVLGARKIQLQQEMILEKQRQIYGDDYGR